MKIEADMYLKTGNYSLLRDVRMRQARFTELEGNERIAISYYCMAFYADLNGFENLDRLIAARDSSFQTGSVRLMLMLVLSIRYSTSAPDVPFLNQSF